jgi:hypothetical protein
MRSSAGACRYACGSVGTPEELYMLQTLWICMAMQKMSNCGSDVGGSSNIASWVLSAIFWSLTAGASCTCLHDLPAHPPLAPPTPSCRQWLLIACTACTSLLHSTC